VILVFFHFGACTMIPFWLRALGIPVIALLEGESGSRSASKRMKDKLSPFAPLPTVLYRTDQLKTVVQLLRAGHVLFMAADIGRGKQITIPIHEHCWFQMSTGAIRLAAKCDAELIPCWMIDEGRWRFRLEICQPVPSEFLTPTLDTGGAAKHLLRELLPVVRQRPEFCSSGLVNCLVPNVPVSDEKIFAA